MTALFIFLSLILLATVLVQIGKATELIRQIKGDELAEGDNAKWNGLLSLGFMILFLVGTVWSAWHYRNSMLGYGLTPASEHGKELASLFNVTLFFTGIVFVLTHIALFWFCYKYRWQKGQKATFFPHDTKLEIYWTAAPAVVMTFLVIKGLDAWNRVMADVDPKEAYTEIEATAQQFFWTLRYPGADGKIGTRDYKLTSGTNNLGQDWTDEKNHDDFIADELVLPVGKKVRVRIIAKDVLHNFYLPFQYVKMDAIPGIPTYFVFKPDMTTAQYRQMLSKNPDFQGPFDELEPNGPKRWEKFEFELACAELCGKGHYSMRKLVKIVTQDEYDRWFASQKSYYDQSVKGTKDDPFKAKNDALNAAAAAADSSATTAAPAGK